MAMHYLNSHLLMLCLRFRIVVGEVQEAAEYFNIRSCCPQDDAEQTFGNEQRRYLLV